MTILVELVQTQRSNTGLNPPPRRKEEPVQPSRVLMSVSQAGTGVTGFLMKVLAGVLRHAVRGYGFSFVRSGLRGFRVHAIKLQRWVWVCDKYDISAGA